VFNVLARNVHDALPKVLRELSIHGVNAETRNGPVLQFPAPLCVEYEYPRERVLFWEARDANPFLHFFESLWMLAGRQDVAFLSQFSKQISTYSDDGERYHAAYGYRWLHHFEVDQIRKVIDGLKADQTCRRQVIGIWDPHADLGTKSKDLPCNLTITFQIGLAGLNMTVFNRSNDIIWGMLGANAVHFSFLHEYVASAIGVAMGKYYQISVNAHAYKNPLLDRCNVLIDSADDPLRKTPAWNPYADYISVSPNRLFRMEEKESWDADLETFMAAWKNPQGFYYRTAFFKKTAQPLFMAYDAYKAIISPEPEPWAENYWEGVHGWLGEVEATDWRKAATEWMNRRFESWKQKQSKSSTL